MKKNTTSTKTPAPAKKITKPAAPKAPAIAPAAVAPKRPAPRPTAPKAVAPKPVAPKPAASKSAPALKPVAPQPIRTVITAQADVGFGNALFLRGEGRGLSWDQGVALECVADDKWSITLIGAERPVVFKFLINDETWSLGEDARAEPGTSVTFTPRF